jgi:hypothetical protein
MFVVSIGQKLTKIKKVSVNVTMPYVAPTSKIYSFFNYEISPGQAGRKKFKKSVTSGNEAKKRN